MSLWQEHQIADKITQILREVPEADPNHHLGYPFLTAYQIAIEFAARYPGIVAITSYQIGGVGIGEHNSLAQYLAQQLSRNIHSGKLPHIDGGFLSNLHLHDISFDNRGEILHSSLTGTPFTLSMFRFVP